MEKKPQPTPEGIEKAGRENMDKKQKPMSIDRENSYNAGIDKDKDQERIFNSIREVFERLRRIAGGLDAGEEHLLREKIPLLDTERVKDFLESEEYKYIQPGSFVHNILEDELKRRRGR